MTPETVLRLHKHYSYNVACLYSDYIYCHIHEPAETCTSNSLLNDETFSVHTHSTALLMNAPSQTAAARLWLQHIMHLKLLLHTLNTIYCSWATSRLLSITEHSRSILSKTFEVTLPKKGNSWHTNWMSTLEVSQQWRVLGPGRTPRSTRHHHADACLTGRRGLWGCSWETHGTWTLQRPSRKNRDKKTQILSDPALFLVYIRAQTTDRQVEGEEGSAFQVTAGKQLLMSIWVNIA